MSDKFKRVALNTVRPYRTNSVSGYNGALPTSGRIKVPNGPAASSGFDWTRLGNKVVSAGKTLLPYASNILNSFRKVPQPQVPTLSSPATNYARVDLSAAKNEVQMQARDMNRSADAGLDSQTAAAVKAGNFAQSARAVGNIAESEANANAQQTNRVAGMNTEIGLRNDMSINRYHDNQTEAQVAQQRESSQNIANAADKYITSENVNDQYDLDLKKFNVLKDMYSNSGVTDRLVRRVLGKGADDVITEEDKKNALTVAHRLGGPLLTMPHMRGLIKKTY